MKAELIFTGSELLLGHVLNTHAQYLGRRLSELGIKVTLHVTVGDDWNALEQVLWQSVKNADLIITTGGLGSTTDDLTKETMASVLGLTMVTDEKSLNGIKEFFRKRDTVMPDIFKKQACFPEGSLILPNSAGTAPGAIIERDDKIFVMLPGPPHEMASVFEGALVSYLRRKVGLGPVTRYKVFRLTGISESGAQERIGDLGGQGNPGIAYVAVPGEVQVRITAQGDSPEQAEKILAELSEKVRSRLVEYIFGYDDEILEKVVGDCLINTGSTLSVAESCTGGLITAKLTDVPGSSLYLKGGVVAYSNDIKNKVLGVPGEILERYGAVSKQTALAMAGGVRLLTGAKLGLAVTGIAGPGGGTPQKPNGLVYISLSADDRVCCEEYRFPGERPAVRQGAANAALNMIRRYLLTK